MPQDAQLLTDLSAQAFREAYSKVTVTAEMEEHIARHFHLAAQQSELLNSAFLIAECEKRPAGYVRLWQSDAPVCVKGPAPLQISRFYLRSEWYGKGVAAQLMEACHDFARSQQAQTLWLMVWSQNQRAQRFYQKCGFAQVGFAEFLFAGRVVADDWVMARSVD